MVEFCSGNERIHGVTKTPLSSIEQLGILRFQFFMHVTVAAIDDEAVIVFVLEDLTVKLVVMVRQFLHQLRFDFTVVSLIGHVIHGLNTQVILQDF